MAGGRVYAPLAARFRAFLCLAAVLLVICVLSWPRRPPSATRSGRLLIENAGAAAAHAATPASSTASSSALPAVSAGALGVAPATGAAAITPAPFIADPATTTRAPVRPPGGGKGEEAPTKPPADEGVRPTSRLSPAAQGLLAEAAKTVTLADDQVRRERAQAPSKRRWARLFPGLHVAPVLPPSPPAMARL